MILLPRTLLPTLLICLVASAAVISAQGNPSKPATTQSKAKQAFEKLKTLAGAWQGAIMGIPITFTIRAVSSGTAIQHEGHTEGGSPPNHEITMFYLAGDRLLSTHYCDAGTQSRLEGKLSADGKSITFSFLDLAGSKRGGYLKGCVFTFVDANHHIAELTFVMPVGKAMPLRGEFTRIK